MTLQPDQFAALFPFHISFDSDLRIVSTGPSMARLCPEAVPGSLLTSAFDIERPVITPDFETIRLSSDRLFLLKMKQPAITARGQMVHLPQSGVIVFVNSPWFTDSSSLRAAGLGFEDFPLHNPIVDMLQVVQSQKAAVAELRELAGRLELGRKELLRAREAAVAASEAKTDFLANMSHEIRTPLNSIVGMSELLGLSSLTVEQREYQETIAASSESLLQLINDFLDVSRIEAGQLEIERVAFDPAEVCRNVERMFRSRARERGIRFECVIDSGSIPQVEGDPSRIRQVLVNLVGNALKFTDTGSIRLSLRSTCPHPGQPVGLEFEVADTGVGIDTADIERIFGKFMQAESPHAKRHGGAGLGLSISRSLAERMGGQLEARSAPGAGSIFRMCISLPAVPGAQTPTLEPSAGAGHSSCIVRRRILLVEDHEENRRIAERILGQAGYDVVHTETAREAVTLASEFNYDLIFMDIRTPDMDGFEATAAIRANEVQAGAPRAPIVALTAQALETDRTRALVCGMDDYITKPYRRRQLIAAAEAWIDPRPLVLLVDDSADIFGLIRAYLKSFGGFRLVGACDVSTAVAEYRRNSVAFVLVDLELGKHTGFDVLAQLRAVGRQPSAPFIAMTGHSGPAIRERCRAAGFDGFLGKPLRRGELLDALKGQARERKPAEREQNTTTQVVTVESEVADLVPGYLSAIVREAQRIEGLLDAGELVAAGKLAHQVLGSGGAYGFPEITRLGRAVQSAVQAGDASSAITSARALQSYLAQVTWRAA